jgi:hypothetical protein
MAKSIEIDRRKRLRDEPHKGHNRWHPDRVREFAATAGSRRRQGAHDRGGTQGS